MEIFVYFIIFMIGAFIGSFASLAVYRLPLKQDILYKHSYCPNCNAKLKTIDLIPIFSYIFLKGKCRNCGKKIRPRYLILEICSGFITLLFVISTGFNINNLNIGNVIDIIFYLIFITTLVLIAGIDKEYNRLQKSIVIFGFIIEAIYLCFSFDFYNLILAILLLVFLMINNKENYVLDFLLLIIYTLFFVPIHVAIINLILLLIYTVFIRKVASPHITIASQLNESRKSNLVSLEKPSMYIYIIITISTLIISNFI